MSLIIKNAKFGTTKPVIDSSLVYWMDFGNKNSFNRDNLLSSSETFNDSSAWITLNSSIIANATTDYLGNLGATKLIASSNNNFHAISQFNVLSDNTVYTYMVELKAAEYSYAVISVTLNNTAYTEAKLGINLSTGDMVVNTNLISYKIITLTDYWFRVCIVFNSGEGQTLVNNSEPRVIVVLSTDGTDSAFLGDGTSGIFIARAHLRIGSDFSIYQNTSDFGLVTDLTNNYNFRLNRFTQIDRNGAGSLKSSNKTIVPALLNTPISLTEFTYSCNIKMSKFSFGNGINQSGSGITPFSKTTGSYPRSGLSISAQPFRSVTNSIFDSSGRCWLYGTFNEFRQSLANFVVRLNTDGTLDISTSGLNAVTLSSSNSGGAISLDKVVIDSLGRIYYCGTNMGIRRILDNGDVDSTFTPIYNVNLISDILLDSSADKMYIVGWFTSPIRGVMKINLSDGSRDTTFNPSPIGFGSTDSTNKILAFNNSKTRLYVAGNFTSYDGTTYNRIFALNTSDGSIDTSFNVGTGFNNNVNCITVDSNDKIYLGGLFTTYKDTTVNRFVRLNPDGSIDNTFDTSVGFGAVVTSSLISGSFIYVGGNFTTYRGSSISRAVRLNLSDGSIDNTFNLGTGPISQVNGISQDPSGNILLVGQFNTFNGIYVGNMVKVSTTGTIVDLYGTNGSSFNGVTDGSYRMDFTFYSTNTALTSVGTNFIIFTINGQTGPRLRWNSFLSFWGRWNNVAVTVNSSKLLTLYLNGVIQGTIDLSARDPILYMDSNFAANGLLGCFKSDEKIYSRALTQAEIVQNYNSTKNRY